MLFRQFIHIKSCTYTYLLACDYTHEAIIIDPVKEDADKYVTIIDQLKLDLRYSIDTHIHADHITASGDLQERLGCEIVMGQESKANCVCNRVNDCDMINIGELTLQAWYTPGHTDESYSFVLNPENPSAIFTGDTLLIRGTGRTDFQNGDPERSWNSISGRIFDLPDSTIVYPGHDYNGWTRSTVGEEKRFNKRLAGRSRDEYIQIMNNLNLPQPKLLDIAVKANIRCGIEGAEFVK